MHSVSSINFFEKFEKKIRKASLKNFRSQKFLKENDWQKISKNCCTTAHWKISLDTSRYVFFFQSNFCQRVFKFHFSTNSAIVFGGGDVRVPRDTKKVKWQMDEVGDKIKFHSEMDLKSWGDREIPFQLTEFNFTSDRFWSCGLSFHFFFCHTMDDTDGASLRSLAV